MPKSQSGKSPKGKSPKGGGRGKRKREEEEDPLFTPDNPPKKTRSRSRSTKDTTQDPALEEEEPTIEAQPGTSRGGKTTTSSAVKVVEGAEEEHVVPEGRKTYSAEPDNWEAQIPKDHCEYILQYFNKS